MTRRFEILYPRGGASIPLVVHVPHSSQEIPEEFLPQYRLSSEALAGELLAMTDLFTDELFSSALDLGGTMFVNRVSRLVMDPERFPDDEDEPMASTGMGAIYVNTSSGARLRVAGFGSSGREAMMQQLYWPYAMALEQLVTETLSRFSRCMIVDAHSFPTHPLPYEDPGLERPDICLGHDPRHSPGVVIEEIRATCQKNGWRVADNSPFSGSYVPLRYHETDTRVKSVMLEIRRGKYMTEPDGRKSEQFVPASSLVMECLRLLASSFREC